MQTDTTASPALEEFFSHYTALSYDKGERILRENEEPSGVFYVREGIVREYLISEEGNELSVMLRSEGTAFPLRWAMNQRPNIYNYQAMTEAKLWRAPRDAFFRFFEDNPAALMGLTKEVVDDVSALVYRMQHIVFGNAQAKIASVILSAARRFGPREQQPGDPLRVGMTLTHQQIADTAGVTRETASLEIKKLRDNGLISYEGKIIVVSDLEQLSKLAFL